MGLPSEVAIRTHLFFAKQQILLHWQGGDRLEHTQVVSFNMQVAAETYTYTYIHNYTRLSMSVSDIELVMQVHLEETNLKRKTTGKAQSLQVS